MSFVVLKSCFFEECPLVWVCLIFSHGYTGVVGLGEEDHRDEIPFLLHHTKSTCYQHDGKP